jgi:hypothetical protein
MKVYLYPHSQTELAALITEPEPALIAAHEYNPEVVDEAGAVLTLRDLVQATVPGEHQILWVPDPGQHPTVSRALAQLLRQSLTTVEPEEPDTDEAKCADCVHVRVCHVAAAVNVIGATISACPEYAQPPTEGEPNNEQAEEDP